MATETKSAKKTEPLDVFKAINDKIIAYLEKGIVPWRAPWGHNGIPRNLLSRKSYRSINLILLASLEYEKNFFLTSKNIEEIGAKVKSGEKGHILAYWNYPDKQKDDDKQHWEAPQLRYYTVYNISQCEMIEYVEPENPIFSDSIGVCERILEEMPQVPNIEHKKGPNRYNPLTDTINIAEKKTFMSEQDYYITLFHDLIHATGHHSRLGRKDLIQMSE